MNQHSTATRTEPSMAQAQIALSYAHAVAAIRHYAEQRALETDARASKEGAALVVRAYLDTHDSEPLKDGETGWCAEWVIAETQGDFDFPHMPDAALLVLARAGAFRAESGANLERISKKDPEAGALIKKWQMPGGESRRLSVVNKP